MKTLLIRLRLAWCALTARRVACFLPGYGEPDNLRAVRIGDLKPEDWDAVLQMVVATYNASCVLADQREQDEAQVERVRREAIEAEIAAILRP